VLHGIKLRGEVWGWERGPGTSRCSGRCGPWRLAGFNGSPGPQTAVAREIGVDTLVNMSPFIDTSKNPMWLDLLYYRDQRVALGIFKVEGDRLIYVEGKHYPVKEWRKAKGNLPGRPKDFNVKKGDEDRKEVLLRSAPPGPEKKVKP